MILAEPMPMMDAPHSMTSCARLQPEAVGTIIIKPLTILSIPTTSRPLLKTLPWWPVRTAWRIPINRNQTIPIMAIIALNTMNRLPIMVLLLAVRGFVTTSPKMVTSAWRDRSSGLVAALTMS